MQSEDTLVQMLAGACSVLAAEGCALAGGHTSEAANGDNSPGIGFSVTGFLPESRVLRKGPLHAGLALVLTKPLGVGVICGRGETVPGVQLDRYGMPGIPEVGHIFI